MKKKIKLSNDERRTTNRNSDAETSDVGRQDVETSNGSQEQADAVKLPDCAKCAEYKAGWIRATADYDNLKKETEKDRAMYMTYAQEQVLGEILPAIDHFETALQHIPEIDHLEETDRKKLQNWITGIKAVQQLWEQMFQEIGLTRVEAAGAFDPRIHTAVGKEEDDTKDEDQILKVIQSGWRLRDKVIRPAKVIVNAKSSE